MSNTDQFIDSIYKTIGEHRDFQTTVNILCESSDTFIKSIKDEDIKADHRLALDIEKLRIITTLLREEVERRKKVGNIKYVLFGTGSLLVLVGIYKFFN